MGLMIYYFFPRLYVKVLVSRSPEVSLSECCF